MLSSLIGPGILAVAAVLGYCWHAYSGGGGITRGLASTMDLVETLSPAYARRKALRTRPATRVTWWTPVREVGIVLGTTLGRRGRLAVATLEDVVLYIAGPRSGKSGAVACHVQDAPGAVLCTSTRPDLLVNTLRSRSQRPVWVFNPQRVGVHPDGTGPVPESTLRWSPVLASVDIVTCWSIAAAHIAAGATGGQKESEYWEANSTRALRLLLAAAHVGDLDMHEVYDWAGSLSERSVMARPIGLLDSRRGRARFPGWAADLRGLSGQQPKTLDSVSMTLLNCVQYMADPALAHAATPGPDEHFTPGHYLASGGTIYVIGKHEEQSPIGPLFSTFIGHLYNRARLVAAASYGQRLDPPWTLVLDEATKTFRVPLPAWTADAGGYGIPIIIAVQGREQLREAFGDTGAAEVWQNATTKITFGGQMDPSTVRDLSELGGVRAGTIGSDDWVPVLRPGDVRMLSDQVAYVLHRATRPVLVRVQMVWQRKQPPIAEPLVSEDTATGAQIARLADYLPINR